MKKFLVSMLLIVPLTAAVVDRVAIAIGNQAITELQIDEELRVTALLNRQPISRDLQSRRSAADRLIQQFLIRREMEVSRYPGPNTAEIEAYVERVTADLGGAPHLSTVLKAYQLDETTLRDHLALQLATLAFVDARFRPQFSVTSAEVREYLQNRSSSEQKPPLPPLSAADQDATRQILIGKRTDDALNVWLEETRKRFDIIYLDKTLQ